MSAEDEVLTTLKALLESIPNGDIETYKKFTDEKLTCFEPEAQKNLIEGLSFHLFFLSNPIKDAKYHTEIINPKIRVYGDTAYAAYSLVKLKYQDSKYDMSSVNETRIFRKIDSNWKMVHFHRS